MDLFFVAADSMWPREDDSDSTVFLRVSNISRRNGGPGRRYNWYYDSTMATPMSSKDATLWLLRLRAAGERRKNLRLVNAHVKVRTA